jgi:hypothetical protein
MPAPCGQALKPANGYGRVDLQGIEQFDAHRTVAVDFAEVVPLPRHHRLPQQIDPILRGAMFVHEIVRAVPIVDAPRRLLGGVCILLRNL